MTRDQGTPHSEPQASPQADQLSFPDNYGRLALPPFADDIATKKIAARRFYSLFMMSPFIRACFPSRCNELVISSVRLDGWLYYIRVSSSSGGWGRGKGEGRGQNIVVRGCRREVS